MYDRFCFRIVLTVIGFHGISLGSSRFLPQELKNMILQIKQNKKKWFFFCNRYIIKNETGQSILKENAEKKEIRNIVSGWLVSISCGSSRLSVQKIPYVVLCSLYTDCDRGYEH